MDLNFVLPYVLTSFVSINCAFAGDAPPPKIEDFKFQVEVINPTVTSLNGDSLLFLGNAVITLRRYTDKPIEYSGTINGLRFLQFNMEPGETLKFLLKGEDSKIVMQGCLPSKKCEMTSSIRNSNLPLWSVRCNQYQVANTTDKPYTFVLILYGTCGYPYRLDIEHLKGTQVDSSAKSH